MCALWTHGEVKGEGEVDFVWEPVVTVSVAKL